MFRNIWKKVLVTRDTHGRNSAQIAHKNNLWQEIKQQIIFGRILPKILDVICFLRIPTVAIATNNLWQNSAKDKDYLWHDTAKDYLLLRFCQS
jgi:hypothetical protein